MVALAVLALPLVVLGALEARQDSLTDDEGIALAAGVTALTRHDLRINPEFPPLPKMVSALPALLAHPVVPRGQAWEAGDTHEYAEEFVAANRRAATLRQAVFLSRLPSLALAVVAGLLLYCLACRLGGRRAGLFAAALWLTAPFVVGLGHLQSQDLSFAVVVLAVSLALFRFMERSSAARLAVLGLACGASLLVRPYGLLLVPTVALVVGMATREHGLRRALAASAVVMLVAWVTVWVGFRAAAPAPADGEAAQQGASFVREAEVSSRMARLVLTVPWPQEYRVGIAYLSLVHAEPAAAYLVGQSWSGARWWYWPVSLAVKFPATTLAAIAAGLFAWRCLDDERRRRAFLALGLPAAVLAAFTVTQPNPIGLRYLLPVIALLMVAAAPLVGRGRRRLGVGIAAVAVGAQLVALWASYPTTLSWTAPPFRPSYRATADANVDWGQDLWRLERWSRGREPWIAYVGPSGVGADETVDGRLLGDEPTVLRGWVAVSVRLLVVYRRDELSWLRAYCPVGRVGGSILVYRFAGPPDPAPGPSVPAPPCEEQRFSTRT